MSEDDRLEAETLAAALRDQLIGNRVVVLEEATSTNDVVSQMASDNPEGLVVFAEEQTAGRGQYGRNWSSARHRGLWLSVLLRPQIAISESARLTSLLAQTIASTIEEQTRLAVSVKTPNDVYFGARKLAGVLVEMRVEAGGGYAAISGMGINVNHAAENFPAELKSTAGSVAMATGQHLDREQFAITLLRNLNQRYEAFRRKPSASEILQG